MVPSSIPPLGGYFNNNNNNSNTNYCVNYGANMPMYPIAVPQYYQRYETAEKLLNIRVKNYKCQQALSDSSASAITTTNYYSNNNFPQLIHEDPQNYYRLTRLYTDEEEEEEYFRKSTPKREGNINNINSKEEVNKTSNKTQLHFEKLTNAENEEIERNYTKTCSENVLNIKNNILLQRPVKYEPDKKRSKIDTVNINTPQTVLNNNACCDSLHSFSKLESENIDTKSYKKNINDNNNNNNNNNNENDNNDNKSSESLEEKDIVELNIPITDWQECQEELLKNKKYNICEEIRNIANSHIEIPMCRILLSDSSDEDTSDEIYTQRHFKPEALERKEANRARGFRLRRKNTNDIYHLQNFLKKSNNLKNCFKEGQEINPVVIDSVIHEYIESIYCGICNRGDREDELLLCDICNGAVHTFCHQPPLKKIPSGRFYCNSCKKSTKKKKKKQVKSSASFSSLSSNSSLNSLHTFKSSLSSSSSSLPSKSSRKGKKMKVQIQPPL